MLNVKDIARKQITIDMNCREDDLLNDGIVFCKSKKNPGCRNLNRQSPFLECVTMGKGIVISGDEKIIDRIKPILIDKSREEVFEATFWYGHSIYFLPDTDIKKMDCKFKNFNFFFKEGKDISKLVGIQGFENSIDLNKDGSYKAGIVMYAKENDRIIAIAGASIECDTMWQIGIDVLPEYRNTGLATYLVNNITIKILGKGIVPYYCAASSNIGSQAIAHRSGYIASWVSTYKNAFDGSSSFEEYLNIKKIIE